MQLTEAQSKAIQATGNVIVVAGAGTGKTSTLVQRCLDRIAQGGSFERLLMVTFTEAAAAEMRHRLRARLQGQVDPEAGKGGTSHLVEQLALVEVAQISTVHSFCLRLVRSHFHELGLDPEFSVLDERQCGVLSRRVIDSLLTECYGGAEEFHGAVRSLASVYAPVNDDALRRWVLAVHRHAQSLPDPAGWLEGQQAAWKSGATVGWEEWLLEGFDQWWREWLPVVQAQAGVENVDACLAKLTSPPQPVTRSVVCDIAGAIAGIGACSWPRGTATKVRDPLKAFFRDAAFLAAAADAGVLEADWQAVAPHMSTLLELAAEYTVRFTQAKRELGGVDFPDLEQLALQLLLKDGRPTAVAEEWKARLDYVFVDECQDINGAQEALLTAVSRHGAEANRFLVGDVKQSIYQFRLADPRIFRGYETAWGSGSPDGQRVLLQDNFRSRAGILDFVNAVFGQLMRESIGGVTYEPLISGRSDTAAGPAAGPDVELHFLKNSVDPGADAEEPEAGRIDLTSSEREASWVASRLLELKSSGFRIRDPQSGVEREVDWGDMAVLLRSPMPRIEAYASAFHRMNIPLSVARPGFLESHEVSDLVSLLRVLDNPLQDIPLLAVLRSPLAGISLDDLACIRAGDDSKLFWHALNRFVAAADERQGGEEEVEGSTVDRVAPPLPPEARGALAEKVRVFVRQFRTWRELVRQVGPSACLETVLSDTGYDLQLAASPRGPEQQANVRRLLELALQFDPYHRQGLYRFLSYLDSIQEADQSLEPAPVSRRDAVQLLSIHRSKGLEFPVVVLAGLGTRFNLQHLNATLLVDAEFGVAPKALTDSRAGRYPTLPHWLAERRQRAQQLGEELRLLYVGATRARDRLICSGAVPGRGEVRWEPAPNQPVRDRDLMSGRCPLDWLRAWLPAVTEAAHWKDDRHGESPLLTWTIWDRDEPPLPRAADSAGTQPEAPGPGASTDLQRGVVERVGSVYSHAKATSTLAKTSVSALRSRATELLDEDAAPLFRESAAAAPSATRRSPTGAGRRLTAAERGTLHHRFMQHLVLGGVLAQDQLQMQLDAMERRGLFTSDEAGHLDLGAVSRFWSSEVGVAVGQHASHVRRELPFTLRLTDAEVRQRLGQDPDQSLVDEFVVVQGVVDLAVLLPEEIWILDFKTDTVDAGGLPARVDAYRPQLGLYARALGSIYHKPVRRQWLHFLVPGTTVDLEPIP